MSVIEVNVTEGRADIRLNRPEVLNAFDLEMFDALASAVDEVTDGGAKVCVVSGNGRSFSSGIDVTAFGSIAGAPEEMIARAQAGYRKLAALEIPTIACVHGHAYGAGLQVALACDLRVVALDASMGLLEINFGLIPDLGGSTALPHLVGPGRAKKMIWTAQRVSGEEAERIGLAEWTVPADDLKAKADEIAASILELPDAAVREAKRLIDRTHLVDRPAGMDAEAESQVRCMTDPGFSEALTSGLNRLR